MQLYTLITQLFIHTHTRQKGEKKSSVVYNVLTTTVNLPSKKLFYIFIPLIILLGIFSLVRNQDTKNTVKQGESGTKVVAVQNAIINIKDTDNDTVPDWEEAIWKTDPKNPKTFNNVPDADYISLQVTKEDSPEVTNSPIVTVDDLSKQLFSEYLQMKKSGTVDADTIQRMTARVSDNVVVTPLENPYTESNIRTFPDTDTVNVQNYAESLMTLVNKYTKLYASQVDVSKISTSGEDFIAFSETTAGFYLKLSEDVMELSVPKGALSAHIDYANSLKESAQSMQELSQIKNDQMRSLTGISRQSQGQVDQEKAIQNLTAFFSQSGIMNFTIPIL